MKKISKYSKHNFYIPEHINTEKTMFDYIVKQLYMLPIITINSFGNNFINITFRKHNFKIVFIGQKARPIKLSNKLSGMRTYIFNIDVDIRIAYIRMVKRYFDVPYFINHLLRYIKNGTVIISNKFIRNF